MANNCLVTKLKSVVENDNLNKLGHIVLDLKSETNNYFQISTSSPIEITLLEGTIDRVGSNCTKIDSTHAIINPSDAYPGIYTVEPSQNITIDFSDYYNLNILGPITSSKNINGLKYCGINQIRVISDSEHIFDVSTLKDIYLTVISLENADYINGDLSFLVNLNLRIFKITAKYSDSQSLKFSPEYVSNMTSLENLTFDENKLSSFGEKSIAEYYGKLTNLTTLRLQGTFSKGTVEDFVAA